MIENSYYLFAIFLGFVFLTLWLDANFKLMRNFSPPIIILFLSGLASNMGLITDRSPFYDTLAGFTVPFAVCLVLFSVDLSDLRRYAGPLMVAFAISCISTIIGVLMSGLLFNPELSKVLGTESWKLDLNFFAMWNGLEIGNPDLFAAANAVDNLTIFPLFAFWVFVPKLLGKWYPVSSFWSTTDELETEYEDKKKENPELRIQDIVALSFAAVVIIVFSDLIKEHLIADYMPSFPTILIITTLALILAQFHFISRLQGTFEIGFLSFYFFFCAVGAMINIKMVIVLSPILLAYTMLIIVVHMVSIYGIGRLLRMDIRVLTIASVAAKAGPPIVLALANVHGWKNLILPGVAIGILGYAVGNYLGFAAAYAMKALLGQ